MDEIDGQTIAATTVTQAPPVGGRIRRRFDEAFRRLSVETWQAGGLSAADFCRREGLNAKSFARWRSQILGRDATDADDDHARRPPPAFVPVTLTPAGAVAAVLPDSSPSLDAGGAVGAIEIVLHGGRHLRVSNRNFDELMLRRLVQTLESMGNGDGDRERQRC